jgi:Ni,Fe-hydrogenase I cytochrome b subunit
MTAILSTSYFIGELMVPNIQGSTVPALSVQSKITLLIDRWEVAFLRKMLGKAFADEFLTHAADTSGIWHNLKDKIYITPTAPATAYRSPVACYVYNFYLKSMLSVTTGSGEGKAKIDGSDSISSWQKIITNWNDMVDQIIELRQWLDDNASTYTTYIAGDTGYEDFERMNQWGI